MTQENHKKTNRLILFCFIAFFSTFLIVDIIYITISQKTWRGLATEDGYKKGLKYNETIEAVKKQKELGWDSKIKYQKKNSKKGFLQVDLLDKNDQKIRDANLTANFKRPAQVGYDFSLQLKFNSNISQYRSEVKFPLIGQWDIEIIAEKDSSIHQKVKRIVVQ
ncbi:MAG: nitrogen fixation protein FixH [Myxococcota bacterium]|jgi:nitrogen fixation protein FixH